MRISGKIFGSIAGAALMLLAGPAAAQDSGLMQIGGTKVSVGGGTAKLDLPDIEFTGTLNAGTQTSTIKDQDDFFDETGWGLSGSIETPSGSGGVIALHGFYAHIEDDDRASCTSANTGTSNCGFLGAIVDNNETLNTRTERDVDHWGVALEGRRQLSPGVMGVTRAPQPRYVAVAADVRGLDQDISIRGSNPINANFQYNYNGDLDTRYYGAYVAYGGGYSLPFFGNISSGLGLSSTFQLRGGVYYADTDYDSSFVGGINGATTNNTSLSDDDVAFIGGLVLETTKRFSDRTALSLKSAYEYYSYVPDMKYNGNFALTRIDDDDAFSMRTSLRLTIKLGPDQIMEPYK